MLNLAENLLNWNISEDFSEINSAIGPQWEAFNRARIFITGGTGFIGTWLLESFYYAASVSSYQFSITVLSRNPDAFLHTRPHLARWNGLQIIPGDVSNFTFPDGHFNYCIHAATDASAALNRDNPRQMFETILSGTRRVLDFALEKKIKHILLLSSGAVYGQQPWDMERVSEDWLGGPDCTNVVNTYAEAKRAAEMLCAIYQKQFGLNVSIARIFALLGPHLPLDKHFAAGNFIQNGLKAEDIIVRGDGRPCRSYLYAADLVVALLRMLTSDEKNGTYNLGSERSVSIAELAQAVAKIMHRKHQILNEVDSGWNAGRYVPDMSKFNTKFGVIEKATLEEAIIRTALWNGWKPAV